MAMTWSQLRALWDERDHRYRLRRKPIIRTPLQVTPEEAEAIRAYRRGEIDLLPEPAQELARAELARWYPPMAVL